MDELVPILRDIGAIKAFYVCIKAQELFKYYKNDAKEDIKLSLNLDFDCVDQIWELYPAMIEFIEEFFCFLDFEFNHLI